MTVQRYTSNHLPKRIRDHIAISFMALVCLRQLEYRVKTQYIETFTGENKEWIIT